MSILFPQRRFTEIISFKSILGHTKSGDDRWGSMQTATARVERTMVDVSDGTSGRSNDDASVLYTLVELKTGDMVWLPGTDTTNEDKSIHVVSVEQQRAIDGTIILYRSVCA